MLSWLSPGWLWALPLAASPVLIHFLLLRRARPLPFGDMSLLREAYRRSLPSSRLRQWLLMAVRCLLIAALIALFARPIFHSASLRPDASAVEEPSSVIFLADVSYSMGLRSHGRTRLQWAADAARAMLSRLRARDRVALALFSDRIESPLEWTDPASLRAAFDRLKHGSRGTDYGAALKAAYDFLRASPGRGRKVIVVLSDNAAHGFRSLPPGASLERLPSFDPEVSLLGLSWQERAENATIQELKAQEDPAGEHWTLEARGWSQSARPTEWRLWVGGRSESLRHASLLAGLGPPLTFELKPSESGAWGRLQLRPDELPEDDAYYYSVPARRRPKALLLYGSSKYEAAGRGGYFLKKLFSEAEAGALPFSLDVADSGRWQSLPLSEYRALILADFPELPPRLADAAEKFVQRGGGLLLIPSRSPEPDGLGPLQRLLPARMGELPVAANAQGLRAGREAAALWNEFDLQNVSVSKFFLLDPKPSTQVWFRDAEGRALMVAGAFGAGRVLLWASSLDIEWTNLAVKPLFAAWADRALGYLTASRQSKPRPSLKVGETLRREWAEGEAAPALVQLRGPQGLRASLRVQDRKVEYPQTHAPGLYFLEWPGADPEAYAVNLDRSGGESDLAPAAAPWRPLRAEAVQEDFLRALYGRDLRSGLLALIVCLLALEMFLSRPARRSALVLALLLLAPRVHGEESSLGDRFVWTQLRHAGAWDPYPSVHGEVLAFLGSVTSVLSLPARRVIGLEDEELFYSPFVLLAGRQSPPPLGDEELRRLREYLTAGGLLWIEDASGQKTGPFDAWVRRVMRRLFPDSELSPLGPEHVVYKTFFLARSNAGRVQVGGLEGIQWAGRTAVIYSRNDLLGAWAKDALGKPLHECVPGGEAQRLAARKLTLNIVMYALTGNYKSDAVHQPYLLQKMRSGQP